MRAGAVSLTFAIVAATAATLFLLRPSEPAFHTWQFAVGATLVGVALLAQGLAGLRPLTDAERFAALGALGGAVLCAAVVSAAFAVGPPHMVQGSPGQTSPVRPGASVRIQFPATTEAELKDGNGPDAVVVIAGTKRIELHSGESRKVGQYVLRVSSGPIALVSAASPDGKHVTITQPQGETFVSPYLLFPTSSSGQRVDFFAVPPLHRTVTVSYYPSYRDDARHIYIASPFVLVQIREENGAALYRGATVSGRPIRGGGMRLSFVLGTFPVVALSAAPATLPYAVGLLMLASGLAGYVWTALRPARKVP